MMRESRFTHRWTADEIVLVGEARRAGLSAEQIARKFKVSRNAILGLVYRVKELREIEPARKRSA